MNDPYFGGPTSCYLELQAWKGEMQSTGSSEIAKCVGSSLSMRLDRIPRNACVFR